MSSPGNRRGRKTDKDDHLQEKNQECNRGADEEAACWQTTRAAALLQAERPKRAASAKKAHSAPSCGNKTQQILALLKRSGGVILNELVKATGWKPNSVRGFLSGTIGKKMGNAVESFKSSEGDRSYRLTGE